jgi:hypothetical protein
MRDASVVVSGREVHLPLAVDQNTDRPDRGLGSGNAPAFRGNLPAKLPPPLRAARGWTDTIAAVDRPLLPVLLIVALALAGCGKEETAIVPVQCKSGPDAMRSALEVAPGRVEVGGVPLSDCVSQARDSADIQAVGASLVSVASDLAEDANADPQGSQALQLGYLIGATRRGASRTQGIHDELVSRLQQELLVVDTSSPAFRRGRRAGRESG